MQKYDWLRLFSEVRPTFLPYAQFTLRTRLLPEECREKLVFVTHSLGTPMLVPVRTSDDPRLLLKGRVFKASFLAVPMGHRPIQERTRTTKPFLLFGNLRPVFDGTVIIVRVVPDIFAFVVTDALLALVSWPIIQGFMLHHTFIEPLLLARLFFCYGILTLPVSFEAYNTKKMLKRLLA